MSTALANKLSRMALLGFAAALLAALTVGAAGPAYRLRLVDLDVAFSLLRWGAWLGLVAVLVALAAAWVTRPGARNRGFVRHRQAMGLLQSDYQFAIKDSKLVTTSQLASSWRRRAKVARRGLGYWRVPRGMKQRYLVLFEPLPIFLAELL